jgi:hypothetical protein
MPSKRALDATLFYVAGPVGIGAIFAAAFLLPDLLTHIWLLFLLFGLALVSLLLFGVGAWRRKTDEVAKEAHKFAAFWGAFIGLPFGLFALALVAMLFAPHHLPSGAGIASVPTIWMLAGALFVYGAWFICFFVALAAWWLRHR